MAVIKMSSQGVRVVSGNWRIEPVMNTLVKLFCGKAANGKCLYFKFGAVM